MRRVLLCWKEIKQQNGVKSQDKNGEAWFPTRSLKTLGLWHKESIRAASAKAVTFAAHLAGYGGTTHRNASKRSVWKTPCHGGLQTSQDIWINVLPVAKSDRWMLARFEPLNIELQDNSCSFATCFNPGSGPGLSKLQLVECQAPCQNFKDDAKTSALKTTW